MVFGINVDENSYLGIRPFLASLWNLVARFLRIFL